MITQSMVKVTCKFQLTVNSESKFMKRCFDYCFNFNFNYNLIKHQISD